MHLNTMDQKALWFFTSAFVDEVMKGKCDNTQKDFEDFVQYIMVIFST